MISALPPEEPVSALPHFAKAAGYTAAAFSLATFAGMSPILFPGHGGPVLLGVAAASVLAVTCINFAALAYGQGAACRYAAQYEERKSGAFAAQKPLP
jgi:hypothetical protein